MKGAVNMNLNDLQTFAHNVIEDNRAECDFIEYKKSYQQEDKILKTNSH